MVIIKRYIDYYLENNQLKDKAKSKFLRQATYVLKVCLSHLILDLLIYVR